ncbi:MAG: phytanoyl-CoA dioxygenase family protein, partial [Planctomycetota bacterium]|nr:phytanoyl-CoA dioxygenase family protein [Planctomycetota bacterium]
DAWHVSRNAHRLATWPRILTALAELYGRAPRPFQTLNFPTGTIQPAHADAVHFNSAPAGFMAGAWVALEDVDETSGPLFYYPGSHRTPEFDMADVGVESSEERYDRYELFVEEVVRTFGFKKRLATLKRGEVLIWASNLIHGGEARRDAARSRHSQVTHYFFEGCRYFTPLESRGLDIAWREPDFLPMEIPRRPWLKRVVRKLRTHFDKDVPVG